MKRVIYLGLFLSILSAAFAAMIYIIPDNQSLMGTRSALEIIFTLLSTWILLRLINRFIWPGIEKQFATHISHLLILLTNLIILFISAMIIVVGILKLHPSTFLTAGSLVVAGLAIALQNLVQDVASSIIIDIDHLFGVGDWIKINEQLEGRVVSIGWRHTELLTLNNTIIHVPNSQFLKDPITNFTHNNPWAIEEITLSINHDVPTPRIKRVVETALHRLPDFRDTYCQVFASHLDAGGVDYKVRYGIPNQQLRWEMRHTVIDGLRQELHTHGLRVSESLGDYGLYPGGQPYREILPESALDALRHSQLFDAFTDTEQEKLASKLTEKSFKTGEAVIRKGDVESVLYLIGEGTVEVKLTNKESKELYSGDFIGEQGFLRGSPRSANVLAKTDVILYAIDRSSLEPFLKKNEKALEYLLSTMSERSQELKDYLQKERRRKKGESFQTALLNAVKEFFGGGAV